VFNLTSGCSSEIGKWLHGHLEHGMQILTKPFAIDEFICGIREIAHPDTPGA
jgi:hypothetical protein